MRLVQLVLITSGAFVTFGASASPDTIPTEVVSRIEQLTESVGVTAALSPDGGTECGTASYEVRSTSRKVGGFFGGVLGATAGLLCEISTLGFTLGQCFVGASLVGSGMGAAAGSIVGDEIANGFIRAPNCAGAAAALPRGGVRISWDRNSRREAIESATGGDGNAVLLGTFTNSQRPCGGVVQDANGVPFFGVGATAGAAIRVAMGMCGSECKILFGGGRCNRWIP